LESSPVNGTLLLIRRAARQWLPALAIGATAAVVAGCGGGGTAPAANPANPGNTTTWPVGTSGNRLTAYLNQNSVTASLPAPLPGAASTAGTVTMTLSETPPQGLPTSAVLRAPRSAGAQPLLYIMLIAIPSIKLPNIPGFDITQRVSHPGPEYIAMYVPGAGWQKVEGPLDGTPLQLDFAPPAPPIPITLSPIPTFFALFGNAPAPSPSPSPSGSASPTPSGSPSPVASTSPTPTPSPTAVPTPAPGVLSLQPAQTSIGSGMTTTFTISEPTYTGAFALTDNCAGIATIGQPAGPGPSTSVSVTGNSAGTCSVTVKDAHNQSVVEAISISDANLIVH
jgi:hypothetical protein